MKFTEAAYVCNCSKKVAVMIDCQWKIVCLCTYIEEMLSTVIAERGEDNNINNVRLLVKAMKILMDTDVQYNQ